MKRILIGAFAAALLISAPAYAQVSIQDQVESQLRDGGIDPSTASQTEIDAALNAVLLSAVQTQLGAVSAADATPAQMAAAVSAILTNNPNLSTGTVAVLTSAAIGANPGSAAQVAGAAVAARPNDAVQITRAAVDANPTAVEAIVEAASEAAVDAGGDADDVGAIVANAFEVADANGVVVSLEVLAAAAVRRTNLSAGVVLAAAVDAVVEEDEEVETVEDVEDGDEENPGQDNDESPV